MKKNNVINSHVSRGGSLRDLPSMPGVVPGAASRLGSWRRVAAVEEAEPGGAWEWERSFLSPGRSLAAFPAGLVNQSPGLVRISCCFRQLLQTQIT